jgi:hypothetical protein
MILTQLMLVCSFANAGETPVWDLSKDNIQPTLQAGKIEKDGGKLILKDGAAFAVPASAFADQRNFTVEVVASLNELIDHTEFTVMKKQGEEDSGFSYGMNYRIKPWYARHIASVVNNVFMSSRGVGGAKPPKINHPYKFTVAVRDGLATFYLDDWPVKKCFMEMIPNNEPMWVGRNLKEDQKPMPVTIHSVKVYGPDFTYAGKEKKTEFPRGVVAGRGWALDIPKVVHQDWPKVLFYGDSISMGYRKYFIPDLRKDNVYTFHCRHFVGGSVPKRNLTEMAGRFKFDAVVFNNGLHSLHWTPDKVSDQEVYKRMKDLAECFKNGAPQAKIFYLLTTPHTAKRPGPGKPVNALGEKNDVVVRLNTISRKVMEEENIPVIDVYTPLSKHLDWAGGDGYHWQGPAYKLISESVQTAIAEALPKK